MTDNKTKGALAKSLSRDNGKIRSDRAEAVVKSAEKAARRGLEDLKDKLEDFRREQQNALDMSPEDVNTLVLAKDFDGAGFWKNKDLDLAVKIRNTEIKLEVAEARYKELFEAE